jgi:hypothetical protein
MVLIDEAAHFEIGKVIICDIKPGSMERSIDLDNESTCYGNKRLDWKKGEFY